MPLLCMVCFVVFAIVYLRLLQPELLAQEQFFFSHGKTTYVPWVGTAVITALLSAVGVFAGRLLTLPLRYVALAWFLPCYLLGGLTAMHFPEAWSDGGSVSICGFIMMPLLYAVILAFCNAFHDLPGENRTLSSYLAHNVLTMAILCTMTCLLGNTDDALHVEMRAASLTAEGEGEEAIRLCEAAPHTSRRLTAIRAYALFRQGELNDRLFDASLPADGEGFLPDAWDTLRWCRPDHRFYVCLGAVPAHQRPVSDRCFLETLMKRDCLPNQMVTELLLTTYLVRRELPEFYTLLSESYDLSKPLPRHFAEAVVLYRHIYGTEVEEADVFYETDYERFTHCCEVLSQEELCQRYGDTYWYYYCTAAGHTDLHR